MERLGEGLEVTGWAEGDELPEAVEAPGRAFALGVQWHPEADETSRIIGALVERGAGADGGEDRGVIRVLEPATEEVLAELPRAGVEETDAAVARAVAALSRLAGARPRRPVAACSAAWPTRSRSAARRWRSSRRATPASRSATRAARWAWSVDTFRYYAAAPERMLGDTIPVAGGVDMTFREPLGVVGLIIAVELPAHDRGLEAGPGAGRRQHASCSSPPS